MSSDVSIFEKDQAIDYASLNRTAATVVVGFLLISFIFVGLMAWQLVELMKNPYSHAAAFPVELLGGTDLALFNLEIDAQNLRNKRAFAALATRLFIQVLSLISGFSLIVMGSSFILARVKAKATSMSASQEGKFSFFLSSEFPGLFLALLGSSVIGMTLFASVKAKIEVRDGPVYFSGDISAAPDAVNQDNSEQFTLEEVKERASEIKATQEKQNE